MDFAKRRHVSCGLTPEARDSLAPQKCHQATVGLVRHTPRGVWLVVPGACPRPWRLPTGSRLYEGWGGKLIAGLIARDAPFYDANIPAEAIDRLEQVCQGGPVAENVHYGRLVASQFRRLWNRQVSPAEPGALVL